MSLLQVCACFELSSAAEKQKVIEAVKKGKEKVNVAKASSSKE